MASGKKVTGTISSPVNARGLHLECAGVLHETLLVPILMYDTETIWRGKERSRIRVV